MKASVDSYLSEGCGRCNRYQTPDCNVHKWQPILVHLRKLLLASGLQETIKWGNPCYTFRGKNVCIIGAFNNDCVLSFFKGSLLNDPAGLLQKSGSDSQVGRVIRFTNLEYLMAHESTVLELLANAIAVEESGLKPVTDTSLPTYPNELIAAFEEDPDFQTAFETLTKGRQRGYLLHFNQAKQAATRSNRIAKYKNKILMGRGMMD